MKKFIILALYFFLLPPVFAAGKARLIILPFLGGSPAEAAKLQDIFVERFQASSALEVQTKDAPSVASAIGALRPSDGPDSIYLIGEKTGASYVLAASLDSTRAVRILRFTVYDVRKRVQSPAAELSYAPNWDIIPAIDRNVSRLAEIQAGKAEFRFVNAYFVPSSPKDISAPAESLEVMLSRFRASGELSENAMDLFRRRGVNARILSNGATLMHFAAKEGRLELLQALMSAGAAPSIPDKMGWTPLHHAAYANRAEIVRYLIGQNISLEFLTLSNETPLHLAAANTSTETARILILNGANINARNDEGKTPLHFAAYGTSTDTLQLLLDSGASMEMEDSGGCTPLFALASYPWKEYTDAFAILLQKGASPNAQNIFGKSPLKAAMEAKHQNIVLLLRRAGAQY